MTLAFDNSTGPRPRREPVFGPSTTYDAAFHRSPTYHTAWPGKKANTMVHVVCSSKCLQHPSPCISTHVIIAQSLHEMEQQHSQRNHGRRTRTRPHRRSVEAMIIARIEQAHIGPTRGCTSTTERVSRVSQGSDWNRQGGPKSIRTYPYRKDIYAEHVYVSLRTSLQTL